VKADAPRPAEVPCGYHSWRDRCKPLLRGPNPPGPCEGNPEPTWRWAPGVGQ